MLSQQQQDENRRYFANVTQTLEPLLPHFSWDIDEDRPQYSSLSMQAWFYLWDGLSFILGQYSDIGKRLLKRSMDAASLAVERKDFERIPNPDVLIHRPKEFAKQLTIHEYLGYDHTFTVLFYATWLYTENLDADPLNKAIGYRDMLYSIKKNKRDKYTLATDMSDLMLIHRYTDAIDIYLSTEKDLLDVSKGKLIKKPSHIFFAISKYMMGDASYYPIAYSGLEYWYRHSLRWSEDGIKTGFIPDWKRLKWAYFYHTICKGTDDIRLILNNLKGYN